MTEIPTLQFEALKVAYRQTKDGMVVSLVVHPSDMPQSLANSTIGTRYQCVLVALADDETPAEQPKPAKTAKVKKPQEWPHMSPTQQAGIRCEEPTFHEFLVEQHPDDWHEAADDPAECVRLICGVESRADLATVQQARVIWKQLDDQYCAWLRV